MGVYIKGMAMPKDCKQCPCSDSCGCAVLSQTMTTKEMKSGRPNWCPMVEVKTPHGDLIDRNQLVLPPEDIGSKFAVEYAPAVIEAEGAEE